MNYLLKKYRQVEFEILNNMYKKKDPDQLKIIHYPNPVLERASLPCEDLVSDYDYRVAQRLREIMILHDGKKSKWIGVGMSAVQIGILKRIFVYCPINPSAGMPEKRERNLIYCFNPEITSRGKQFTNDPEGCLSDQSHFAAVKRHQLIEVKYHNIKGELIKTRLSGWESRIFQHEMDHLNGNLCRDCRVIE